MRDLEPFLEQEAIINSLYAIEEYVWQFEGGGKSKAVELKVQYPNVPGPRADNSAVTLEANCVGRTCHVRNL